MARTVQQLQSGRRNRPRRSRLGPTIFTVILLIVLAAIAPFLAKHRDAPQEWAAKLEAMSRAQEKVPKHETKNSVWVNRRSGLYYCRDSKFYGRIHPGERMRQESALLKGFRPAPGQECP